MKLVAGFAFLLNTILFATYYSISKEVLGRIDPMVFSFFEMTSLVPVALCVMLCSWKDMNRAVVKRGIFLGSWLYLALITIAIALKYTTATSTAFYPSLNGFLAALIAWALLRQPVRKLTWLAGALSVAGTILLVLNTAASNWRGSLIAMLGGVFFTCYVFLSDHQQKDEIAPWPLLGIELLTMALWSNLVVLLFGDWRAAHPSLPHDLWVVLYVAGACTFIPILITVLMQKHISPVTVSFIYILEPVLGAVVATLYLHEMLPMQGYAGGLLVVAGAIIHTLGTSTCRQPAKGYAIGTFQEEASSSWAPQALPAPVTAWNIQSHLQVGSVPYSVSRKGEKTLVQHRRLERLQRLAHRGTIMGSSGGMMPFDKLMPSPVGADLSRPPPIDRPPVDSLHPDEIVKQHTTLPNQSIEATGMRLR
jgi:drug/metabolite transporter (DMT)-like permease